MFITRINFQSNNDTYHSHSSFWCCSCRHFSDFRDSGHLQYFGLSLSTFTSSGKVVEPENPAYRDDERNHWVISRNSQRELRFNTVYAIFPPITYQKYGCGQFLTTYVEKSQRAFQHISSLRPLNGSIPRKQTPFLSSC